MLAREGELHELVCDEFQKAANALGTLNGKRRCKYLWQRLKRTGELNMRGCMHNERGLIRSG